MTEGSSIAPEIAAVASAAGIELPALAAASKWTEGVLAKFREDMDNEVTQECAGADVALMGSIARGEATPGSDCDYLVVLSGAIEHHVIQDLSRAAHTAVTSTQLNGPGSTGTFGDFTIDIELFSRIGLESDTNANTTRRILLLFESVSGFKEEQGLAIRRHILDRYMLDYAVGRERNNPVNVPHFLLNDLVRYWRTMAVDFGAKQWRSLNADWYLRYAKLLTTRKVLFAGSLASLFTMRQHLADKGFTNAVATQESYDEMISYLLEQTSRSPLARLCSLHPALQEQGQAALADLLLNYETFISMISDKPARQAIQLAGQPDADEKTREAKAKVEAIGRKIGDHLATIFHDDPLLQRMTRAYGLF